MNSVRSLLGQVRNTLQVMRQSGCDGFDVSAELLQRVGAWGRVPPAPVRADGQSGGETLEAIRAAMGDCRRCRLCSGRTRIVFGAGSPTARLVFVGEGPGFEEDRQGEPFVGPAGQLLNRIIQAMSLTRQQVYIANVIKCRPPDNRNPLPDEIDACMPFLRRQLAVIRPSAICVLGAVAARTLLQTDAPISRLRGRFHEYRSIPAMPTFHPAYLLRNPEKKRAVWQDIQQIMKMLATPAAGPVSAAD